MRAFWFTAVLLLAAGPPADAGLCRRPDGTYTNHCNESDAEVSGGTVSRSSAPASKPASETKPSTRQRPAPASQEASGAPDTAADERYWRDRFARAKEAVSNAERRLESAKSSQENCMARTHAYDACNEDRVKQAEAALEKAQEQLQTGVFNDCRQSSRCSLSWVQ